MIAPIEIMGNLHLYLRNLLRLGIILGSGDISAWIADFINEIDKNENIELVIVVRNNQSVFREKFIFSLFRKIDQRLLPGNPNLLERTNLSLTKGIHSIYATPITNGQNISYKTEDLEAIKKSKPDLLLHFNPGVLHGEILTLCKYGVWCLKAGEVSFNDRSSGFWEWFHKIPVTKIAVIRLNNTLKKNECMVSTVTKTEYLSLSRNQTAVFSKGIDLLIGLLVRFATSENQILHNDNPLTENSLISEPGLKASIFAFGKLIYRIIEKVIAKVFFIEQWVLFYSFTPLRIPQLEFRNFTALIPPKDYIWADPFVITQNNKHYIFIEELSIKTNKGHISCLVLNDHGEVETSSIIIDQPFHLSYPFIFQHENTWFMVPESADNMTVDLYECLEFPFTWKYRKSLLTNVRAFDSTLHFQDGVFWLFCTIQKRSGSSTNEDLFIFYSKNLLDGEWKSHHNNPVLSNPFSARPAGRIFFHENTWYRPSQICVPRYGYGLSLNKIIKLSESEYQEEIINTVDPGWRRNLLSVHTLNFSEGCSIIDGQLKRFKI